MAECDKDKDCNTCKGSGKQTFRGLADSYRAACNFCGGHGTRVEEVKWFDSEFKGRGLGAPVVAAPTLRSE